VDSKLVVAVDVFDCDFALDLAREIGKEVFALKVNWPLLMVRGSSIVSELSRYARVICDLKIADIPNTNRLIVDKVSGEGAWGVISHSFTGEDSLKSVVEAAGDTKVFSVVAMSHPGASQFIHPRTDELIDLSIKTGVYGLIAPGNNYEMLSGIRARTNELVLLTPGIGAQGGTPEEAMRHGADLLIVGRAIYNAEKPIEEVRRFNSAISQFRR
jgi:orotidine-5'-phosphate decarboxylase